MAFRYHGGRSLTFPLPRDEGDFYAKRESALIEPEK